MCFQRVSARRNYEFLFTSFVRLDGFQRVSARRNYEFVIAKSENETVSSVSLHVGIMNFSSRRSSG